MRKLQLIKEVAPAVEALYRLDIRLSNGFTGKDCEHDRSLHRLRSHILRALDELTTTNLFKAGEGYLREDT